MAVALTRTPYERAAALLESVEARGMLPGLERTHALLEALGNPQAGLRGALVAGTNGKGSVCATVDSVLRAAGLRTVMLTKPHLRTYCERIAIDGQQIDEDAFCAAVESVFAAAATLPSGVQPTAFEMLTAAGLLVAGGAQPDALVCEVGLGGRLDSTNVLDLGVAVVTNVGLDHCERLGSTLEAIATEKAAIIKPGNRAVTGATQPSLEVVRARASAVGARLTEVADAHGTDRGHAGVRVTARFAGASVDVECPLLGCFQVDNVAVALATCDALRAQGFRIEPRHLRAGCEGVRWAGRMQWVEGTPPVLVDGAHNPPGVAAMVRGAMPLVAGRRRTVVFAAMRDKDVAAMLRALAPLRAEAVIVTAPQVPRSTPAAELRALAGDRAIVAAATAAALDQAREIAGPSGAVIVCGSLYLAGEALTALGAP